MNHAQQFFQQSAEIANAIDPQSVERIVSGLIELRNRSGRLFLIGVGGSAANCSHAVNDFRKIAGIEALSPCDNVSELTARANDEGWETIFEAWLKTANANEKDVVLVLSVGGGNELKKVSVNIVRALREAKKRNVKIYGIVGRDGGFTKEVGDEVIVIPTIDPGFITPHTEAFQSVVCHCLVSHPKLSLQKAKWEGMSQIVEKKERI